MAHRISTIDTRHKVITHPYIQKGITFEKVLCQYTIFEQEVRFRNCTFIGDVVFGEENLDQAYCVVNADLVFDNCIFRNKVKLDGLQCAGHVVFKGGCKFEYGDVDKKFDYALSMSNATIGLGVCLQDSFFNSGINLSATHIRQVGCQFFNVRVNNKNCDINFCSSFMGKELSINASNICCNGINFESVSVDENQGTLQFKGLYLGNKDDKTVIKEYIESLIGGTDYKYEKIVSLYRLHDEANSPIVLISESDEIDYDSQSLLAAFRLSAGIDDTTKLIYCGDSSFNNYGLLPIGDIASVSNKNNSLIYLSILYEGSVFLVNLESLKSQRINLEEIAPFVFQDIRKHEKIEGLIYEVHDHRGVPMIYAKLPSKDGNEIWSKDYIAIYDSNHNYKIYKWNYIKCEQALVLSQTHVGRGLYIKQSELDVPKFDMHALSAQHEIWFEDIVFNVYNLDMSQTRISNIKLYNIDFVYKETPDNIYINYPEDWVYCGINLDCSHIVNTIILKDITASEYESYDFVIKANLMIVDKILDFQNIVHVPNTKVFVKLQDTYINQLHMTQKEWDDTYFETDNLTIDGLKVDERMPTPAQIKEMKGLIGRNRTNNMKPISFLKQVDKIYERNDYFDGQKDIWKYRNRMRIWRDNNKCIAIFKILSNELLLDYGWSPWRIVLWLAVLVVAFDTITCRYFGMEFYTSLVNGFVEFVPVSFNEPIVEQLHGVNPKDPKYGPPLLSLGYSALVTGYRLLSYTLLSVLIAAWAGYFKKRNQ